MNRAGSAGGNVGVEAPVQNMDEDRILGRQRRGSGDSNSAKGEALSPRLYKRIGGARGLGRVAPRSAPTPRADARQRAVVKIKQVWRSKGSSQGTLQQHVRYLARDTAARDEELLALAEIDQPGAQSPGQPGPRKRLWLAYDRSRDHLDPIARVRGWSQDDRHFRITISAEYGGALKTLRPYTRTVMARAERSLGTRLDWLAMDHWDTDNPHTHVLVRGRREDGRALALPGRFIERDLRNIARDAATLLLGPARPNPARERLLAEARTHGPTRLDPLLASQLDQRHRLRLAGLRAPTGEADLTDALKARARELERLGLAHRMGKQLELARGWRERLEALGRDLELRRSLQREHALERVRDLSRLR